MIDKYLIATDYFNDLSNFTVKSFLDRIRDYSKDDWCLYMLMFNDILHKSDFMKDLKLFAITQKNGQRQEDIIQENVHLLKEYLKEIKKEDFLFQEYAIICLMPIRYYFKEEMTEIINYFNTEIDKLELDEKETRKRKITLNF